jgi:vesicle-associated membrane protein 7
MTILYALVARGKTVLSEFTFTSGNFPTITRLLLGKIDMGRNGKMSYVYDAYVFHYLCADGLLYLCMCDDAAGSAKRRVPFAFLDDVRARFLGAYGDEAHTAIAFAMNLEFSRVLQRQMELFNGPMAAGAGGGLGDVHRKLDAVKDVMVQNIEMVLERGEKLELLVDKSDRLNTTAFTFEKSSRKLKEAMFWKKVKLYILALSLLGFIVFIITWVACGADFGKCKSDQNAKRAR